MEAVKVNIRARKFDFDSDQQYQAKEIIDWVGIVNGIVDRLMPWMVVAVGWALIAFLRSGQGVNMIKAFVATNIPHMYNLAAHGYMF